MAEFKKLSEVEQVDSASDTATVLIEEGGEIKRVAKSEVGGAGVYVLTITTDNYDGTYCTENYDDMYDVLLAGGSVWADLSVLFQSMPSTYASAGPIFSNIVAGRLSLINWVLTDIGLVCDFIGNSYIMDGAKLAMIFPNGSHNPEGGK